MSAPARCTVAIALALAFAEFACAQQHDHSQMDHSRMDHGTMDHAVVTPPRGELRTPIPPLTDADRAAAFPALTHAMTHATEVHSYLLVDRLEVFDADPGTALAWEAGGWLGSDLDRLWLRTEGAHRDGHTEAADVELLYGRSVTPWWDVVAGLRQDLAPGDAQTWAAVGLQGLAPYKFEIQATAYIGESGRTAARLEIEYELLLTNRLILQPLVEVTLYGKDDPARGIESGVSTAEAGLRLRYEIRRRIAPYLGVSYEREFRGDDDEVRAVVGLRGWL
ncbi:MAG: Copper resistance protein B [Steroidobacteraceae bacterium]|nr:Copper resistance protein B [Steroidobacteraceae bacterium]